MGESIGSVMRRKRAAREKQEDRLTEDLLHHAVLRDAVYDAAMELHRAYESLSANRVQDALVVFSDACRKAEEVERG